MIKLPPSIMKQLNSLLRIVYPPKCMLCHKLLDDLDGEYVCRLCLNQYHQERPNLLKGQTILQEEAGVSLINQSQEELGELMEDEMSSFAPTQIIALFPYTDNYRRSILRWKYKGIRKYAKGFAKMLVEEQQIFKELKPDILIPVPLAPSRMRKRGFNQALDLARAIGEKEQIPVWDCLKRYKDTKPQAECSREERLKNIQGSIVFKKKYEKQTDNLISQEPQLVIDEWGVVLEGGIQSNGTQNDQAHKNSYQDNNCQDINSHINYVALVDDIYTTGSTARECIKILKEQYLFKDAKIVMIVVGKGNF